MEIEIPSTGKPCIKCSKFDGNPLHAGICNVCYSNAIFGEPRHIVPKTMALDNLSLEEKQHLKNWISQIEASETAQVMDLIDNCNITFQFAKTHSVYVKDWEKTKKQMENNLSNGVFPHGVSVNLFRAIIDASDEIMQRKLKMVRDAFQKKFNESIFDYIGSDGKTRKLFGIF